MSRGKFSVHSVTITWLLVSFMIPYKFKIEFKWNFLGSSGFSFFEDIYWNITFPVLLDLNDSPSHKLTVAELERKKKYEESPLTKHQDYLIL